jgi:hypothetical protein
MKSIIYMVLAPEACANDSQADFRIRKKPVFRWDKRKARNSQAGILNESSSFHQQTFNGREDIK